MAVKVVARSNAIARMTKAEIASVTTIGGLGVHLKVAMPPD